LKVENTYQLIDTNESGSEGEFTSPADLNGYLGEVRRDLNKNLQ
jgi:hypothetical protein